MKTNGYAARSAKEPLAPWTSNAGPPARATSPSTSSFCGVCHSDFHTVRSEWPGTVYPSVTGHEIVGRVVEAGVEVTRFKAGGLAAVGCIVDSCRRCPNCLEGLEQFCDAGFIGTHGRSGWPRRHVSGTVFCWPTGGGPPMKNMLGVAMALLMAAPLVAAEADETWKAGRKDAPRLMKEAVTAGTVDADVFAAIADWILHEKEERVAAGLIDVLGAIEPEVARASGAQWNDTTRAVFSLFTGVLRDAQGNRRRGGHELDAEIAALVRVAAPAVAGALREIDPAERARLAALMTALAPLAGDVTPLLGADITAAAREALEIEEE